MGNAMSTFKWAAGLTMLFALALFLSANEDALSGGTGRSLLQLYSTGTETISMGPNGMMSSSGSFEMGYMNSFKRHVSHAAHHVSHAAHHVKQRIASVAHKMAKFAEHLSTLDNEVTNEQIDAYVNKPSTLKRKGWTKEIAHKKAKYFYKHHDVFQQMVDGKFDAYDENKNEKSEDAKAAAKVTKRQIDAYVNKQGWSKEIAHKKAKYFYKHHDVFQQMVDGKFDAYDKNKNEKSEDAKAAAKATEESIANEKPLTLKKMGTKKDVLKKVQLTPQINCPVARCAECLPGQQTEWLPEVRDKHGCPRLCNFKCVGDEKLAKPEEPMIKVDKIPAKKEGAKVENAEEKNTKEAKNTKEEKKADATMDMGKAASKMSLTEEVSDSAGSLHNKTYHKIKVVHACIVTVVVCCVLGAVLLAVILIKRRRTLAQQYEIITKLGTSEAQDTSEDQV